MNFLNTFDTRNTRYCLAIPSENIDDRRQVPDLTTTPKSNLQLHRKTSERLTNTGSKIDTWTELCVPCAEGLSDATIAKRVGRA